MNGFTYTNASLKEWKGIKDDRLEFVSNVHYKYVRAGVKWETELDEYAIRTLRMLVNNKSIRICGDGGNEKKCFGVLERLTFVGGYSMELERAICKEVAERESEIRSETQARGYRHGKAYCMSPKGKNFVKRLCLSHERPQGRLPTEGDIGEKYWEHWFSYEVVRDVAPHSFEGIENSLLFDKDKRPVEPFGVVLCTRVRDIIRLQCSFIAGELALHVKGKVSSLCWDKVSEETWPRMSASPGSRPEVDVDMFFKGLDVKMKRHMDKLQVHEWPSLPVVNYAPPRASHSKRTQQDQHVSIDEEDVSKQMKRSKR